MKKFTKSMKGKKVLSFVLAAIMLVTTFSVAVPVLKLDANAAGTIDGVSQTRVVTDYATKYAEYAKNYLNGCSEPTNIIVPGLNATHTDKTVDITDRGDYVIQGMTYFPERDWILVTAYHSDAESVTENTLDAASRVFALDASTGEFVAMFSFLNPDGETYNKDHGGGIAVSENNLYYACGDKDRYIAYVSLDELRNAPVHQHTVIKLEEKLEFYEVGSKEDDGKTAYTAYVCYDDGILWTGNFYDPGAIGGIFAADYKTQANNDWDSMVFGYKLAGNSSEEEWACLKGYYKNLLNLKNTTGSGTANNSTFKWNAYNENGTLKVVGSITPPTAEVGEFVGSEFASFDLTEGKKYKIKFISTNNQSDMYMFAPNSGGHCNVKQSSQSTITQLKDGRYLYEMTFTAGVKPAGADSSWPTALDGNGVNYTGTYTLRFDQDKIQPGEKRDFVLSDISIEEVDTTNTIPTSSTSKVFDAGSQGSPSYAIALADGDGLDVKQVQYAVVDNGKLYLSRSYGSGTGNSTGVAGYDDTSHLTIAEMDLSTPGTGSVEILVAPNTYKTISGVYLLNTYSDYPMMAMSEGLCVIDDHIFVTFEGASNKYKNESNGSGLGAITAISNTDEPVDVVWKIDQYALMGNKREDDQKTSHYERVDDVSQINEYDEYIIVHESQNKDPYKQTNVLYALDAFGSHNGEKMPKLGLNVGTGANGSAIEIKNDYTVGMEGHAIVDYTVEDNRLYLHDPEDNVQNLYWRFSGSNGSFKLRNSAYYYTEYNYLHVAGINASMAKDTATKINLTPLGQSYYMQIDGFYFWCNDGAHGYDDTISDAYQSKNLDYIEQAGTFHSDALNDLGNQNQGANILNAPIDGAHFGLGEFKIYKRVLDPYSETQESRVYTDMNAKVESDGTYTVNLETYAVSSAQYQVLETERPTDFIFVLDASGSMTNNVDAKGGYHTEFNNWSALKMEQAAGSGDIAENKNYNKEWTSEFYYRLPDYQYARISVAVNQGSDGTYSRDIWLWCKHPVTGRCYKLSMNGYLLKNNCTGNPSTDSSSRLTESEYLANPSAYGYANSSEILTEASNDTGRTDYHSSRNSKDKRRAYEVMAYKYTDDAGVQRPSYYSYGSCYRLEGMQQAVEKFMFKIAEEATNDNLNHRIALITFGSDSSDGSDSWLNTGIYINGGNVSYVGYNSNPTSENYKNAFFSTQDVVKLRKTLYDIRTDVGDPDTFSNYGLEMANGIIKNSGANYLAQGDRSACVIMITDGVPGKGSNTQYLDSAMTTANAAIAQARNIKKAGGYVFTARLGSDGMSGFDMDKYMDYTSSEYVSAESLSVPKDRNIKDIEYRKDFPLDDSFNLDSFVSTLFHNVQENSMYAFAQLDGNSIIQQKLSSVFDSTNAKISASVQRGYYDEIGRLKFDEGSNATTLNPTVTSNTIQVTGFDYSTEYISKEKDGKRLLITVTGLIPHANVVFENTPINNDAFTAIYQSQTHLDNTTEQIDYAFKHFPEDMFNIPEYTYVMDYGVKMLDTDVNGTLCSVSNTVSKQAPYSDTSANGALTITNNNLDLLYQISPDQTSEAGYSLIKRDDGTYDWFKIKLVPASNVLYEEDILTATTKDNTAKWSTAGEILTNTYQSLSGKDDRYGYDEAYANNGAGYSNGSAYKATVNSNTKRSETMKFSYTGTGFDLMAACGASTGIEIIKVMKVKDGAKTAVKAMIVDTYYNGEYNEGENSKYADTDGLLKQVPIARYEGEHGTYEVEVTAAYLSSAQGVTGPRSVSTNPLLGGLLNSFSTKAEGYSIDSILDELDIDIPADEVELVWFDDNSVLNGGTGPASAGSKARSTTATAADISLDCYIDSVRVYNPLGDDTTNYIASEKGAQYYNIIDELADTENGALTSTESLFAYVTGALDPDKNGTILSFENYQAVGPQHEVYLERATGATGSHAVSFKVTVPDPSSRVMISLRAVNGATTAKIASGDSYQFDINTATEQYFDITPYLSTNDEGVATVTVTNVGDGLLSVNNLKVVDGGIMPLSDEDLPVMAMSLATEPITIVPNAYDYDAPVVNEDVQEPETDAPAEDETPEADEPVTDVPMDLTSIIKMLLKFIETIILKFF